MIYTCYEMIRDCRADKPEGWRHFIANYVPVMQKIAAHYDPRAGSPQLIEQVLSALRRADSGLFESLDNSPERWFIAQLRQKMLATMDSPPPEIDLSLETVAEALAPLTLTQKLAAWIETMRYDSAETGAMLRMAPDTVSKIRDQAADLLRGKLDNWRRTLLAENGRELGRAAAGRSTKDCPGPKVFLDVLDGRATWRDREDMERHAVDCWHCIDHFGRMAEVIELLRGIRPLEDSAAAPWLQTMGIAPPRKSFWQRK